VINQLLDVDKDTGEAVVIGDITFEGLLIGRISDIAYNTDDMLLYAIDSVLGDSGLWTIDPSSGAATFVIALGSRYEGAYGLVIDGNYYTQNGDRELCTIDIGTGELSPIGRLPFRIVALTKHPVSGFPVPVYGLDTGGTVWSIGTGLEGMPPAYPDPTATFTFPLNWDSKLLMGRDYNLDGLLDMGEVRLLNTENYALD
jgi:hypothetical protein